MAKQKINHTILLSLLAGLFVSQSAGKGSHFVLRPAETSFVRQDTILVDDFAPQPLKTTAQACRDRQGKPFWCHNRLGGDRGEINPGTGSVEWGKGFVKAIIASGVGTHIGVFTSLNHPIRDCEPINFSAIFPPQIEPQYQGRITGIRLHIRDGRGNFQVELQRGENNFCPPQISVWRSEKVSLSSGQDTTLQFDLPDTLAEIQNLNWQVIGNVGDFAIVDRVELIAELPELAPAQRAFLWSYAMLISNWDQRSGLTRDHAYLTAGEYDNISASGMQAAAAVMTWRLGFISTASATEIVERTTVALLKLPRCHGLWPHFVKNRQIIKGTEWSSIDTIIALVALLEARQALGLPTGEVDSVLSKIEWGSLIVDNTYLSHGYIDNCSRRIGQIGKPEAVWKDFGTESWLVNFGYAAATSKVAEFYHEPPTFNGSGFIDELAWLLAPPPCRDRWGTAWRDYRQQAADRQLSYYQYHPCYLRLGIFGLSAAYVPDPSAVPDTLIYQAFGIGGDIPPNDGTGLLGHAVIVPHYAAMIASIRPSQATAFWQWLEQRGLFTPLNNVESFMFIDEPICEQVVWNDRKDSWNLSLQTLGWGRLLTGENNPLYQAIWANDLLRRGYETMIGTTGVTERNSAPLRFALLQNYPNPVQLSSSPSSAAAKASTKIPFLLAAGGPSN